MPEKWSLWSRNLPVLLVQGVLLILALGAVTTPALAHRMLVFAFAQGDTIHVESKFASDRPVRQGKVVVLDQKTGKKLLTGQTDDQGKSSFKIPDEAAAEKMDLKIVVEASMGHQGEWLLKADSYLTGTQKKAASSTPALTAQAPASTPTPVAPETKAATIDRQLLEEAMNKALQSQLAPIKEMLTELTIHRTSLTDIIGGIGYIMGIFGLWAYFVSKRRKDS